MKMSPYYFLISFANFLFSIFYYRNFPNLNSVTRVKKFKIREKTMLRFDPRKKFRMTHETFWGYFQT